jgi:hypothetical protein
MYCIRKKKDKGNEERHFFWIRTFGLLITVPRMPLFRKGEEQKPAFCKSPE